MLKQIATKTTIHGVKDAWNGNWFGRAFFLSIFGCCFTVMVVQLKGLFQGYISEAVGTRQISSMKFDTVELPSFYYCNKNWLPMSAALWSFRPIVNNDSSLNKSYHKIYKECVHMAKYNISLDQSMFKDKIKDQDKLDGLLQYLKYSGESKQYCKPFLEYWKSMIKQELVNAIVEPLQERNRTIMSVLSGQNREMRPELSMVTRMFAASILADPIQGLLNTELSRSMQAFVEASIFNVSLDRAGHTDCEECGARDKSSSAIMSQVFDMNGGEYEFENFVFYLVNLINSRIVEGSDPFLKTYDVLSNFTLHPTATAMTLDGVCFEYPAGAQLIRGKTAVEQKRRHVVTHLGGFVHQLRALGYHASSVQEALFMADNYNYLHGFKHHTDIAISKQKFPVLYFNQKIRVDGSNPLVNVKYWMKSTTHANRNVWPCRPDPWTELDQAHCNQELSKSRQKNTLCETYLPASGRYPEAPVTNETCIYDHADFFKDISTAMSDVTFANWTYTQSSAVARQLAGFVPARLSYDERSSVISRLTETTPDCPKPCSRVEFNYQTSYPARTKDDARMCHLAMAYWLTPRTTDHLPGNRSTNSAFNEFYMRISAANQASDTFCSVIEYEELEAQEHISEEYLLYSFPDLAANLGGAVGLWMGASMMSVVQLIYLCCLKQLFRRIRRKLWVCSRKRRGCIPKGLNRRNQPKAKMRTCKQTCSKKGLIDPAGRPMKKTFNLTVNRFANKTTIHGVQDAWRANWVGRFFFLSVFACCLTVMGFQLKGVFHGYVTEAVGGRVTSAVKLEAIELPSYYYCNKNWRPHAEALWRYKPIINHDSSLNNSYHKMYMECVHMAGYNRSFPRELHLIFGWSKHNLDLLQYRMQDNEPKQYCKPFIDYWKSTVKQDVVKAVLQPLDATRVYDRYRHRRKRPELSLMTRVFAASVLTDHIQSLLNSEFSQGIQAFVENYVMNMTLRGEGDHIRCTTCTVRHKTSSTIISQAFDMNGGVDNNIDNFLFYTKSRWNVGGIKIKPSDKGYADLSNYTLQPSAVSTSLDGVCWEYAPRPQYHRHAPAVGRTDRHVVMHLGGLVHHLQILGHISTRDDLTSSRSLESKYSSVLDALDMVIVYAKQVEYPHYTHVAVSKQKGPDLYFNQKIRVDGDNRHPLVSVKYWTRSSSHLNRKAWPCRPSPWTALDQAHCNQELSRPRQEKALCQTYLPASRVYPETPITNRTCIYDHTGMFKDISTAMSEFYRNISWNGVGSINLNYTPSSDIARQLSDFDPSRVRYDNRSNVISHLTKINSDCPRPCSQTIFSYEISYPPPTRDDVRLCHMALAYWLTKQTLDTEAKSLWFAIAKHNIAYSYGWKTPFCSVIEYEQTEAQGQISEEYLLYGLPDVAANVGGTLSLWIGASVMSFVQLIYLCCLKRRFRRIHRKVRRWRTKRLGRRSRSIASTATANNKPSYSIRQRTGNEDGGMCKTTRSTGNRQVV